MLHSSDQAVSLDVLGNVEPVLIAHPKLPSKVPNLTVAQIDHFSGSQHEGGRGKILSSGQKAFEVKDWT